MGFGRQPGQKFDPHLLAHISHGFAFPVAADQVSPAMAAITAYRVINAVPYVCAAAPGIRTTADLPNIVPRMD
jgi:4-hydroxy-tetrahydrodipicolinate reductase